MKSSRAMVILLGLLMVAHTAMGVSMGGGSMTVVDETDEGLPSLFVHRDRPDVMDFVGDEAYLIVEDNRVYDFQDKIQSDALVFVVRSGLAVACWRQNSNELHMYLPKESNLVHSSALFSMSGWKFNLAKFDHTSEHNLDAMALLSGAEVFVKRNKEHLALVSALDDNFKRLELQTKLSRYFHTEARTLRVHDMHIRALRFKEVSDLGDIEEFCNVSGYVRVIKDTGNEFVVKWRQEGDIVRSISVFRRADVALSPAAIGRLDTILNDIIGKSQIFAFSDWVSWTAEELKALRALDKVEFFISRDMAELADMVDDNQRCRNAKDIIQTYHLESGKRLTVITAARRNISVFNDPEFKKLEPKATKEQSAEIGHAESKTWVLHDVKEEFVMTVNGELCCKVYRDGALSSAAIGRLKTMLNRILKMQPIAISDLVSWKPEELESLMALDKIKYVDKAALIDLMVKSDAEMTTKAMAILNRVRPEEDWFRLLFTVKLEISLSGSLDTIMKIKDIKAGEWFNPDVDTEAVFRRSMYLDAAGEFALITLWEESEETVEVHRSHFLDNDAVKRLGDALWNYGEEIYVGIGTPTHWSKAELAALMDLKNKEGQKRAFIHPRAREVLALMSDASRVDLAKRTMELGNLVKQSMTVRD
eukprot:GHVS01045400.1.p1 GENE.GHVS01045400.1~~GHVS01045400.1.p1  ORF type:complete len:648 (+),score=36.55 GHVS01045400.1:43-1986(+)